MREINGNLDRTERLESLDAKSRVEHLIERGFRIDAGDYFKRAFEIWQKDPGSFIAFALISTILGLTGYIPFVGFLFTLALAPLQLGVAIVTSKIVRGESYEFSDFFSGFNEFGNLIVVYLLMLVFVVIGLVFLLIPGIYLAIGYLFAMQIVYFYKVSIWDAMEASRKLVTAQWFDFFVFVLIVILVVIVGLLACGIGILVALPVIQIATYLLFDDIFVRPFDDEFDEDVPVSTQEGDF